MLLYFSLFNHCCLLFLVALGVKITEGVLFPITSIFRIIIIESSLYFANFACNNYCLEWEFIWFVHRFGCEPYLLHNMARLGFNEPTPIQRQAIPVLLSVWSYLFYISSASADLTSFCFSFFFNFQLLKNKNKKLRIEYLSIGLIKLQHELITWC